MIAKKSQRRFKIKKRVRKHIIGTADVPRLSVFRSNKDIYAQLIDDSKGVTLLATSSKGLKGSKTEQASKVGKDLADKAKANGIEQVVFDRNGYLYHGRVQNLAEGAREGGLKF